jgi:hypothetical protein
MYTSVVRQLKREVTGPKRALVRFGQVFACQEHTYRAMQIMPNLMKSTL